MDKKPLAVLAHESVRDEVSFCVDQFNEAFAKFQDTNNTRYLSLMSENYNRWLRYHFHVSTGLSLSRNYSQETIALQTSVAEFEGERIFTATRVHQHEGKVYVSLDGSNKHVIEIDSEGSRECKKPPVVFIATPTANSLPAPCPEGKLLVFRDLLKLDADGQWLQIITHVVHCLMGFPVKVILLLQGERGSGKTTISKVLGKLIDPSKMPLQDIPLGSRNLMIAAKNSYLLVFDNQGKLTTSVENNFCRLSTGGGFRHRRNYSDTDEIYINVTRPIIINGISHELSTAPDLISRSVPIAVPHLTDKERISEQEFWSQFEEIYSSLVGDIFNLISGVLRLLPSIPTENLPRLTDFCRVGCAVEQLLGFPTGTFLDAFEAAQQEALETASEADELSYAIIQFMERKAKWVGTATEFHQRLSAFQPYEVTSSANWPKSAKSLGKRLRSLKSMLASQGIEFTRVHSGDRKLHFTNTNHTQGKALDEFSAED